MVEKFISDKAEMVLIVPCWKRDQLWWRAIQPYIKGECHYSPSTEFFEKNGIHFPLTWQVDCFWVDGKLHTQTPENEDIEDSPVLEDLSDSDDSSEGEEPNQGYPENAQNFPNVETQNAHNPLPFKHRHPMNPA